MKNVNKGKELIIKIFKKNIGLFAFTVFIMVITTILGIIGPIIVKKAIDVNMTNNDVNGLFRRVIEYLIVTFSMSILTGGYIYLTEYFGQNFLYEIKTGIFKHIVRLPMKFFDNNPVGKIMARIESDGEAIRQFFTSTVISIITDILMFIGMLFVMSRYSLSLTFIVLLILPLIIILSILYKNKVSPIWVSFRKTYSELMGVISDTIKSHKVLKVFNAISWIAEKINSLNKKLFKLNMKGEIFSTFYYNSMLLFETITLSLIIWFGGVKNLKGTLTVGTLVLFITYVRQFFGPIRNLSSQFQLIQKANASLTRINGILNEPIEVSQETNFNNFKNKIVFKNVYFEYKEGKNVLSNINLEINKGEKVALVGRTGSGKTTLISILLRFYHNYEGSIKIDNQELKTIGLKELRSKIGAVFQDNFLFPDTIYKNIVLDRNISEKKVLNAIKELGLQSVFDKFEQGILTEIKEDGSNVSSGERQIISIVRSYIKDPDILILDEATSSVDNITERYIIGAFEKFMKDRTSLVIAHKLHTIINSDKIVVFKKGHIVEYGTHETLLEKRGYYYNLYESQFEENTMIKENK